MHGRGRVDLIPEHLAFTVELAGAAASHRVGNGLSQQGVAGDGEALLRIEGGKLAVCGGAAGRERLPHIAPAVAGVLGVAQAEILRIPQHLGELLVDLEQLHHAGRGQLACQVQQQLVVIAGDMAGRLHHLLAAGRGVLAQIRQVEQQDLFCPMKHHAVGRVADDVAHPLGVQLGIPAIGQIVVGADPEDHQIVLLEAVLLQELGDLVVQVVDDLVLGIPGDLVVGHRGGAPFRFVDYFQPRERLGQLFQPDGAVGEAALVVGRAGGEITAHLAVHLAGVGEAVAEHHYAGEGGTRLGGMGRQGEEPQ
ncbi:hypothetical protein D3C85_893970 [compost metagenome]